ncbi:hypothetical protein [Coxiella endosymbiont of Ornithodoros maritimus]|uniref:hypothetical protein n=1 Tax=Coxiella endosymbiont of Ornithodoros maritimus TaxID=1656172 RepID=UPI002264390E|nr:hypothetical protein [Coxiella endosymbiont of Ornithodoros maritimus]
MLNFNFRWNNYRNANYLFKSINAKNLTKVQCRSAIFEIINGAPSKQVASFLAILHNKPETVDELYGMVSTMQNQMLSLPSSETVLDIVGTGGDNGNMINYFHSGLADRC